MEYLTHIGIIIGIFIILSVGLNLLVGFTGIVSIMHASLYGLGAYISALTSLKLGFPFGLSLFVAGAGSAIGGSILGKAVVKLKGDYLALATFGFSFIIYDIFNNWISLTRGPMGIVGIPQPFNSQLTYLCLVMIISIFSVVTAKLIAISPFGRLLKAIRDDEELASVLGRNTEKAKVIIFIVSAFLAGLAGSLYAHYVTFIDPSSFTIMESIMILAMIIVGGLASIGGTVFGVILLVSIPEILRFVGLPSDIAAILRQLIFGIFLVLLMIYRPQGIMGKFRLE